MTKKKRDQVDVDAIADRPWCFYCDRDFDDDKVLVSHQRAKHYKCETCGRRLNTAGGLSVHMQQVHKETLHKVENAIEGREAVDREIFGMVGVPDDVVAAHKQAVYNEYFKVQAERQAKTGNPPPGQRNGEPSAKRQRVVETPEELKARLQEHRAKKATEREAKKTADLKREGEAAAFAQGLRQQEPQTQQEPVVAQEYGANPYPNYGLMPGQERGVAQEYGADPYPNYGLTPTQERGVAQEYGANPYPNYGLMPGQAQQHQTMNSSGWPVGSNDHNPMGAAPTAMPPSFPVGHWPHNNPGPAFPPMQYNHRPYMATSHSPVTRQMPGATLPPNPTMHQSLGTERSSAIPTPSSLPPVPGLPPRPTFEMPNLRREDMQRMHAGQATAAGNGVAHSHANRRPEKPETKSYDENISDLLQDLEGEKNQAGEAVQDTTAETTSQSPVDQAQVDQAPVVSTPAAETAVETATVSKKKKKSNNPTKLVYTDASETPEEKLAGMPKYAFNPDSAPQLVQGAVGGAVTGVTVDEDTVLDVQD